MRALHDRMPVIIDPADDLWLGRATFSRYPADRMGAFAVNPWESNPKHEGPRCPEREGA